MPKFFLLLILILCLGFVKCGFDMAALDWRFADKTALTSFPESLMGSYFAVYSSNFLSGKVDCGKEKLVVREKELSFFCGENTLAFCTVSSIAKQSKNYRVSCKPLPKAEGKDTKPIKVQKFTINYVFRDRIAIVDDASSALHSFNRIYHKENKGSKRLN